MVEVPPWTDATQSSSLPHLCPTIFAGDSNLSFHFLFLSAERHSFKGKFRHLPLPAPVSGLLLPGQYSLLAFPEPVLSLHSKPDLKPETP